MKEYTIKIKKQGSLIQTVRGIVAKNAADAIANVERLMGDETPDVRIDLKTGAQCVFGWSGHEYSARQTA